MLLLIQCCANLRASQALSQPRELTANQKQAQEQHRALHHAGKASQGGLKGREVPELLFSGSRCYNERVKRQGLNLNLPQALDKLNANW